VVQRDFEGRPDTDHAIGRDENIVEDNIIEMMLAGSFAKTCQRRTLFAFDRAAAMPRLSLSSLPRIPNETSFM
jgi:hypothetical protein